MVIGMVGGLLANLTDPLMVWIGIDDAVGATSVHGFGGAWGMIAVGIFRYRRRLSTHFSKSPQDTSNKI